MSIVRALCTTTTLTAMMALDCIAVVCNRIDVVECASVVRVLVFVHRRVDVELGAHLVTSTSIGEQLDRHAHAARSAVRTLRTARATHSSVHVDQRLPRCSICLPRM